MGTERVGSSSCSHAALQAIPRGCVVPRGERYSSFALDQLGPQRGKPRLVNVGSESGSRLWKETYWCFVAVADGRDESIWNGGRGRPSPHSIRIGGVGGAVRGQR